jgi:hypothetical protein
MILPTQQHSILLKTLIPIFEIRLTNQKVGSSNPPGRTIFSIETAFLDGGSAAPFYFLSSVPGITPFNGFANSFCNSGCGSGFLGSIWSRIAAL